MEIRFSPNQRAYYRVSAEAPSATAPLVRFGFGRDLVALVIAPLRPTDEPASFAEFCARWDNPALGMAPADLWAGFMALRYSLGFASRWEQLGPELRRQAHRADPWLSDDQRSLVFRIHQWSLGWEQQLDSLRRILRSDPIIDAQL